MENVTVIRSQRRRSLALQILPDLTIKVAAPFFVSDKQISQFLKDHQSWIQQTQQKMSARNPKTSQNDYLYLGKKYELELRPGQKNIIELEDKLYVASTNEKYVKNYLTNWYKQQARKIILERVHLYAKALNLKYKSVSLMSATTRWGSCSSEKNLNFNWKLVMAPLEAIDYVVAHELAHLVELNHSPQFWETVRKMFPIYRQYRTWFKRYGHTLTI